MPTNTKKVPMQFCVSTSYGKFFACKLEVPPATTQTIMFLGTPIKCDKDGVHEPIREVMVQGPFLLETLYDDFRTVLIPTQLEEKSE